MTKLHRKINGIKTWILGKIINTTDESQSRLRKREDKYYKYKEGKKGYYYRCYRYNHGIPMLYAL